MRAHCSSWFQQWFLAWRFKFEIQAQRVFNTVGPVKNVTTWIYFRQKLAGYPFSPVPSLWICSAIPLTNSPTVLFLCTGCMPAHHVCARCPGRPEDGTGFLGTGATDGWALIEVLGIKCMSSRRAAGTVNWAVSQLRGSHFFVFKIKLLPV